MAISCPKCGSDKTQKRNIGKKVAGGLGATAGGIAAVTGGGEGATVGLQSALRYSLVLER